MQRPDRFTEKAQDVIGDSQRLMQDYRHSQWDVEHVFLALVRQDTIVPVAHGLAAAESGPSARLHIFEACDRWPQVERPDEMAGLLREFFSRA